MSLQYEKTPSCWMDGCYPCHENINSFLENLVERYRYIKELLNKAKDKIFAVRRFWLPGFFS